MLLNDTKTVSESLSLCLLPIVSLPVLVLHRFPLQTLAFGEMFFVGREHISRHDRVAISEPRPAFRSLLSLVPPLPVLGFIRHSFSPSHFLSCSNSISSQA